jgi:hypothetical protein
LHNGIEIKEEFRMTKIIVFPSSHYLTISSYAATPSFHSSLATPFIRVISSLTLSLSLPLLTHILKVDFLMALDADIDVDTII